LGLPYFLLGILRQLAGRALRFNLFGEKKSPKSISTAIPNANCTKQKNSKSILL